jgi:hypothetical protein
MRKIILILSLLIILVFTSCNKQDQIKVRCVYGHDVIECYDKDNKLQIAFIGYSNYIVVLNPNKLDTLIVIDKKENKIIK